MRIAIVSDIHGNLTAFEAVLRDLRSMAPDLIFHGGDLADAGANPVEIVDRIQQLGWPGVLGNTDEMLFRPEALAEYSRQSPAMQPLLPLIADMAAFTRGRLGATRVQWLSQLPTLQKVDGLALVHASLETAWRAPGPEAADEVLRSTYGSLAESTIVYGHIHQPFVRRVDHWTLVNSGSVSLSYDGDPRASYAIVDDGIASIRRVGYEVEREVDGLSRSGLPHWQWMAKILQSARPQLPE